MSYAKVRKELAESHQPDGMAPCAFCGVQTQREMLSDFGRCFRCYQAYCREPRALPDTGSKERDPRSFARALKARHDAGERLTPAQVSAYKAALRSPAPTWDDE